jgi:hypothetical protein
MLRASLESGARLIRRSSEVRHRVHPVRRDPLPAVVRLAPPAAALPFWLLREDARPDPSYGAMPPSIGPLGATLLDDLVLTGTGFLFSAGRFVRKDAHLSETALRWLERNGFPDNPRIHPPANDVVPVRPALIACGAGGPVHGP